MRGLQPTDNVRCLSQLIGKPVVDFLFVIIELFL